MSTDATNTTREAAAPPPAGEVQSSAPKKFLPGQTVCNERRDKGKLCNGHLKQTDSGALEAAESHLRGDDVLYKCQSCGALYMGPPLGHVRDPEKQKRFVESDLVAILRAAGGTLPYFGKQQASAAATPKHAPAAKPAAKATPSAGAAPVAPPAPSAAPAETPEEKKIRLARVVAEARKKAGKPLTPEQEELLRTAPAAASTSGTDSSSRADAHRPAAEAQAMTGQASAAPLSPAAATASPVAGAETPAELAPDPTPAPKPPAPRAAAPASSGEGGIPPPPAHLAPPPGETHEEKIARLRLVVAEAKRRAGKE